MLKKKNLPYSLNGRPFPFDRPWISQHRCQVFRKGGDPHQAIHQLCISESSCLRRDVTPGVVDQLWPKGSVTLKLFLRSAICSPSRPFTHGLLGRMILGYNSRLGHLCRGAHPNLYLLPTARCSEHNFRLVGSQFLLIDKRTLYNRKCISTKQASILCKQVSQ